MNMKPPKPTPVFPLFPHANGQWAKKIDGKLHYFGPWHDPDAALAAFQGKRKHTKSFPDGKPKKPHKDFPLSPHANGQWAKKINGTIRYFGTWADADAALREYLDQKDVLLAGGVPSPSDDRLTLRHLCNCFLTAKQRLVDSGEIRQRTWSDYKRICEMVFKAPGFDKGRLVESLTVADFERLREFLAQGRNPVSLKSYLTRARILFNYASRARLLDRPLYTGDALKNPSPKVLRESRQSSGKRMFEPAEIRMMIHAANDPLKAMILLGINCGFGNEDCGRLPPQALRLEHGWVQFPRPKTGIERRAPLWPETTQAITEAIRTRPRPENDRLRRLAFLTSKGNCWAKDGDDNPISKETAKLLNKLRIDRAGLSFYALRHTFQTIGGETRDQVAVSHIMGHVPPASDMASVYRERISDERLKAVTDFVREWLFGPWFRKSEILSLLESASPQLRAMILLGINCGLGEDDVAGLTLRAVDIENCCIEQTVGETDTMRRISLWPETADALKAAIASRPKPKTTEAQDLVFLTEAGKAWTKTTGGSTIGKESSLLLKNLGIERQGLEFESLQWTFQELGREHISGQALDASGLAGTSLECLNDEQLKSVTDFVRAWLFGRRHDSNASIRPAEDRLL